MGAVGFRRRIHGRKRVNTDFEDDFVPVRMSLVVDSVRCPEFLGDLDESWQNDKLAVVSRRKNVQSSP